MAGLAINTGTISGNISGFYSEDRSRSTTPVLIGKNGSSRISFSLAHNVSIFDKDTGKYNEQAHFFEFTVWGKMASYLADTLSMGQGVVIQYSLRQDSWEQDGVKRSKIKFQVDSIIPGRKANGKGSEPAEEVDPNSIPF